MRRIGAHRNYMHVLDVSSAVTVGTHNIAWTNQVLIDQPTP